MYLFRRNRCYVRGLFIFKWRNMILISIFRLTAIINLLFPWTFIFLPIRSLRGRNVQFPKMDLTFLVDRKLTIFNLSLWRTGNWTVEPGPSRQRKLIYSHRLEELEDQSNANVFISSLLWLNGHNRNSALPT